jgi:outer membrane protein assembly factor BamE (lipoprotein component of BamABCDE complex)
MISNRLLAIRSSVLAAAALCIGSGLSGCLIGTSSHTTNKGNYVSPNTLAQIQPGKDKSYVVALLGEPSTKSVIEENREIWKWCFTEEKHDSGTVIFVISSERRTETERTTFVEFADSKVVRAWSD